MIDSANHLSTYSRFQVNKWLKNILNRTLPPVCLVCEDTQAVTDHLCAACRSDLPWNSYSAPSGSAIGKEHSSLDQRCVPLRYAWPVDHLVKGLKFQQRLENARPLAAVLTDSAREEVDLPDVLVPVPLHRSREFGRGFNQARELARLVAGRLGLTVSNRYLRRARMTQPQSGLNRVQRISNVRGVFHASPRVAGLHVALVDDVMTTGATLESAASALRAAGAARVDAWCVARAELGVSGDVSR